jgi:hypothetical protein
MTDLSVDARLHASERGVAPRINASIVFLASAFLHGPLPLRATRTGRPRLIRMLAKKDVVPERGPQSALRLFYRSRRSTIVTSKWGGGAWAKLSNSDFIRSAS